MKISVKTILFFKLLDIALQIICFIVFLVALPRFLESSLAFIEAPVQMLSCLIWAFWRPSVLPDLGRRAVQRAFAIVTITGICCFALVYTNIWSGAFLFAYAMLFIGPACGLWYFIVTCREAYHLKKGTSRPHMFI